MRGYVILVMLLRFVVDLILILGINRISGYPPGWLKAMAGAAAGGVFGGLCMLPQLAFLAHPLWQLIGLGVSSMLGFGLERGMFRRSVLFILAQMAMSGISMGLEKGGIWSLLASAVGMFLLYTVGLHGQTAGRKLIPIELQWGTNRVQLTALNDTGNGLRDPVTGSPVLVVSAKAAQELIGLSREQLKNPVKAMTDNVLPGLRLIPYRTVGESGMLLALRLPVVRIGKWKGSSLVAFAPEGLDGAYQALTGGAA